jgi:molecular chaperone DnaK (HSP70)
VGQAHPEAPFDQQAVTVTIPASFDPGARELTAEAARNAGYTNLTLLEEPQAALYSWIQGSEGRWRKQVKPATSCWWSTSAAAPATFR